MIFNEDERVRQKMFFESSIFQSVRKADINCSKRIVWAMVVKGCPKLGLSWGKAMVLSQQKSHKP